MAMDDKQVDEVDEMSVDGEVAAVRQAKAMDCDKPPALSGNAVGSGWEEGKTVLPGDRALISELTAPFAEGGTPLLQVGVGLSQQDNHLVVHRAGILRIIVKSATAKDGSNIRIWIEGGGRRYYPCMQDMVIGVVTGKGGDDYRLDIRGPSVGILPSLSFEGATKRSRPKLEIGSLVFCRVLNAYRDAEPELTCISVTHKKGWMTGSAMFGELQGGFMFEVSIGYAHSLLHPDSHIVSCLGRQIAFEIAVGTNGRVWVKAENVEKTVLAVNALRNAEHLEQGQAEAMVEALTKFSRNK